jgi:hypothetical protein
LGLGYRSGGVSGSLECLFFRGQAQFLYSVRVLAIFFGCFWVFFLKFCVSFATPPDRGG